jgi:hypothetical protein
MWPNAVAAGWHTGQTPKPGAVMVLDIGDWGHVAIVQTVNGDGTIDLWDSNYNYDLKVRKRRVPNPPTGLLGYLYAEDSDTPPILQNSLVRAPDGITVYYAQNGRKYHVASYDIVLDMTGMPGWTWPGRDVTQAELDQYRAGPDFILPNPQSDGLLVRELGDTTVYLMQNGRKRAFQSPGALNWMGRDWFPDVIEVAPGMLSDPSYVLGTGNPIHELAGSLRTAHNTNAGDPNCTAPSTWKGWPVDPNYPSTFSKCLEFPIEGVGNATSAVSGIVGAYQNMGAQSGLAKGAIEQTGLGTFAVHGEIFNRWRTEGYASSPLGFPTSNEFPTGGGRQSNFEGGYIYWNSSTNTTTIIYSPATCSSFSLSPTTASPSASGGGTTVTLTGFPAGCTGGNWSASGNGSWITVSPPSGVGPQTVTVSWAQNNGAQRSGSASIANNTFTVTQAAATCTSFSIWPTSAAPTASSGGTTVTLTGSPAGCTGGNWSASGNGSWITVNPLSGVGPQTVTVSWAQNGGSQRSGSATIAGKSFTVGQAAASAPTCTSFSLSPSSASPSASGGGTTVTLAGSPAGCTGGSWSASGNGSWITVSPSSGVGPQTVTVSWAQNSGGQRSGSASIANNTFTVTQAAATCTSFSIWPTSTAPTASSGQTTVTLTGSPAGCTGGSWSASGNGFWITVSPPSGVGPQTVAVSWAQNSGSQRSGSATIAGNTFAVTQAAAGAPTCTSFSLSPNFLDLPAATGQILVSLTGSPSGCGGGNWSASGNGSWITVSPTNGVGPQTVTVSWEQNTGGERGGSIPIASNSLLVIQAGDPGAPVELSNAVPYFDSLTASVAQQGWKFYSIDVPAGAETLDVVLDQMSDDVDLYVSHGEAPTLGWHDCAPYIAGPIPETCSLPSPEPGIWWIGVNNWDVGTIGYRVTATYAVSPCAHFLCEDFNAPLSGWTLSGVAQPTADGKIELTPADTWRWGIAARDEDLTIDRFTARFRLEVSRPDSGFGADGMTFAFVEGGPWLNGSYGSSLGYGGLSGRSFAIEFDTYANWELGEVGTHVGLDVDGSVFSTASSPISSIRNQGPIDVRIVFDQGWVRVFLQGGAAYPAETLVLNATIPTWQPFFGRFAFTAATGGYGEVHTLDDLTIDLTADAPSITEPVVWTSAKGVSVTGSTLLKTAATAWGNAGAISTKSLLSGDGHVEFVATDKKTRILGLSNGDVNYNANDIDYGLYLNGTQIRIYEKGVYRGAFGGYTVGDVLRVSVESGNVKYHRNGTLLYTSAVLPTYPLLVDTALYTKGAGLSAVAISGSWVTPPLLSAGGEPVGWKDAVGVLVWGNTVTKSSSAGWGNAGAAATRFLPFGDGYVEFQATEADTRRILGLSKGDSNLGLADIDFGLYLNLDGRVFIYEKGVSRGAFGTYAPGDVFRVSVEGGFVRYRRNGVLLRTSTRPAYPLLVDTALYSVGATLSDVVISGAWR